MAWAFGNFALTPPASVRSAPAISLQSTESELVMVAFTCDKMVEASRACSMVKRNAALLATSTGFGHFALTLNMHHLQSQDFVPSCRFLLSSSTIARTRHKKIGFEVCFLFLFSSTRSLFAGLDHSDLQSHSHSAYRTSSHSPTKTINHQ